MSSYRCFTDDERRMPRCPYMGCGVFSKDGSGVWTCWAETNPVYNSRVRVHLCEFNAYRNRTVNECPLTTDDWRRLGVPEDIIKHRLEWEARPC